MLNSLIRNKKNKDYFSRYFSDYVSGRIMSSDLKDIIDDRSHLGDYVALPGRRGKHISHNFVKFEDNTLTYSVEEDPPALLSVHPMFEMVSVARLSDCYEDVFNANLVSYAQMRETNNGYPVVRAFHIEKEVGNEFEVLCVNVNKLGDSISAIRNAFDTYATYVMKSDEELTCRKLTVGNEDRTNALCQFLENNLEVAVSSFIEYVEDDLEKTLSGYTAQHIRRAVLWAISELESEYDGGLYMAVRPEFFNRGKLDKSKYIPHSHLTSFAYNVEDFTILDRYRYALFGKAMSYLDTVKETDEIEGIKDPDDE